MKATTAIILDTRKRKKDGTYPLKLRVTHSREQKYYPTSYSLTIEDFEKSRGSKPRGDFKDIALNINAIEKRAKDSIASLPAFTWIAFEKQFVTNKIARTLLVHAFEDYAKELREAGRIGTAVSYECAQRSINKYIPGAKYTDITPEILRKYEKWMLGTGNSITTVGIYLRSLRTLFNNAIAEGTLTKDYYPFGKKKYEIPTGNNIKKALSLSDIALIFKHELEEKSSAAISKDYWIFMYLCNGINVKDMCLLKYDNISDEVIEFERAKTARTKRKVELIRVPLTTELKAIIERRGNKEIEKDSYIFPILKKGLTPERERQLIQQLTQLINSHMKDIAENLGITKPVTTYAARHSFATILQRSGVGTDFISEALGHSSVKTTQNYLAGFEDKKRMEAVKALTDFEQQERA